MFLTKPILLFLTLTALVSADFFGGFGPFGSNGAKKQNNGGKSGEKSTPTTVPVGGSTVSGPTSTAGPKCPEAKYCICVRKCGIGGSAEKNATATIAISSTPTTVSEASSTVSSTEGSSTITEASSTISSTEASSTVSEPSSTVPSTGASSSVSSVPSSSTHKNKQSGESGEEKHDDEEWHGLPPQIRKRWLALHGRKHLEQQPAAAGEGNCKMECKCISVPKFSAESEEKSGEYIKGSGEKKAGGSNTGCDYKNKGVQRADYKNARVQEQKQMQIWNKFNRAN